MKSEPKLPYGILKGRLVSVKEVSSGLACGCVCPRCKQRLVAKKGEIKVHHFAHHNADPCDYAVEVAVHMLARQMLEEAKRIKLLRVVTNHSSSNKRSHKLKISGCVQTAAALV